MLWHSHQFLEILNGDEQYYINGEEQYFINPL